MIDIKILGSGTGLKDFISSLVKALQTNGDAQDIFYTNLKLRSFYNGRKMVLQRALNEIFGLAADSIRIETNLNLVDQIYFFNAVEAQPNYFLNDAEFDTFYIFNASEILPGYHFTVKIPIGIYTAELDRRVRAETTLLHLGGRTFNVITY